MTGAEVLAAYEKAKRLVKEGRFDDALAVDMYPSDRKIIERMIEAARAKTANELT